MFLRDTEVLQSDDFQELKQYKVQLKVLALRNHSTSSAKDDYREVVETPLLAVDSTAWFTTNTKSRVIYKHVNELVFDLVLVWLP